LPSFFTTQFSLYAIGGLFLALVTLGGVEELRIHNWRSDYADLQKTLDDAKADLAVCHANTVALSGSLDHQNAALKALKAQRIAAQKAADDRAKAALAVTDATTGEGFAVMNAWIRREYGGGI
jgi:predicted negative regulator of RcsB-dependent stress response